ncbi:MAG: hypothetical protein WAV46_02065 [Candidatus Moraniibacteriota bacterium]
MLCQRALLTKSGMYSCLAFFSFGMMGIVPVLPRIPESASVVRGTLAAISEKTSENPSAMERCYWQEDVTQFLTLQEQKKGISQTDIPCAKKLTANNPEAKKKRIVSETELGTTIHELTDGYPLQAMAPMIAQYDRGVAALIVGIAKKESNWGKRVPLDKEGADCFNYWGYKGAGTRGVAMGHGCFGSPEEAVTAVGNRLKTLVALRETSAPADMIIWKCGSSCKGHSDESVRKWISDVSLYYNRVAFK